MHCRIVRASIVLGRVFLCAIAVAGALVLPREAFAWGQRTHVRISELALDALPQAYRNKIAPYKNDILQGVRDNGGNKRSQAVNPSVSSQVTSDIQVLMLVPHDTVDVTHYFAYRLGEIGCSVADVSLPFSSSSTGKAKYQEDFEKDVDKDVDSLRAESMSIMSLAYPSIQMERVSREAQKSESIVRSKYLSGKGYAECRNEAAVRFKSAVEIVTNVWLTILSNDPGPAGISSPTRVTYYTNQIRFSCEKGYLGDAYAALRVFKQEGRRVPLTPAFIGNEFFNLPPSPESRRIYDLATVVDPQCSAAFDRKQMCDAYLKENPNGKNDQLALQRKIPQGGNIHLYRHPSGLLVYASEGAEIGPDYVLLNFQPVKTVTTKIAAKKTDKKTTPGKPGSGLREEIVELEEIINLCADEYGLSPALIKAVIKAESNFDPNVVSNAGASGLMQLMPSTAMEMQVDDIFDPAQNIAGGCQYLSRMLELFNNDRRLALAAYNAGPGSVLRYGGMPPFKETREYVPRVLTYYEQYRDNPSPVIVKVALNKNRAAGYPRRDEEMTITSELREVREEEMSVSTPRGRRVVKPKEENAITIYLKNGRWLHGKAYEKATEGRVRLKFDNGWIDIREELIDKIIARTS